MSRDYEVTVTVREHWSIVVRAESAAEARQIVRDGKHSGEWTHHSDRVVLGMRVRRADDTPAPVVSNVGAKEQKA